MIRKRKQPEDKMVQVKVYRSRIVFEEAIIEMRQSEYEQCSDSTAEAEATDWSETDTYTRDVSTELVDDESDDSYDGDSGAQYYYPESDGLSIEEALKKVKS